VREAVAGDALVSEPIDAMLNARAAGIEPQNLNKPAPPPLDDEQEQADMRALDARLSRSGNIRDAVALYNARKSSQR
jgi:hypothetical protein